MSFLYNSKKKANTALSHDSDDDEIAAFDPFKSSSTASKNKRKGAATTVKADEDTTGKKAKKGKAEAEVLDEDDDEESKREAKKIFDQLYQSSNAAAASSQSCDIIEVIDSPPLFESKTQTKNYEEISKKLKEIKQQAAKSSQSVSVAAIDVSPEPQPKIQVRKILTAKERQQAAEERAKTLNSSSTIPKASQQNVESDDDDDENRIEIKVRLNSHEKKWKIKTSDPFSKLKKKLSAFYNVPENKFKLKFDGDNVDDNTTPEDEDIEDGFQFDAVMDKALAATVLDSIKAK